MGGRYFGHQIVLESVYAELLAVIDADEGSDASAFLDPQTISLYEQHRLNQATRWLTRRRYHLGPHRRSPDDG